MTLVISSLGCGGAERVISTMVNYWAEQGEEVTIATLDPEQSPSYPLHPAVRHLPSGLEGESGSLVTGMTRNLHRIAALRRVIHDSRPDAVISFMDKNNVLTL